VPTDRTPITSDQSPDSSASMRFAACLLPTPYPLTTAPWQLPPDNW